MKCCLCGKEITMIESHNPAPVVSNSGDRCCADCNENVVAPTRMSVWSTESELRLTIEKLQKMVRR